MGGNLISQPTTTVNIVGASVAVGNTPQKVLFIGQKSTGTAVSGQLIKQIDSNKTTINNLFGEDSIIANMLVEGRGLNGQTRFDAIALDDDGGAVPATGDFTFAGTATADGELKFSVGSRENHQYTIPVSVGDTHINIADALLVKLAADGRSPASGASALGILDLTAINGGELGNGIGLEVIGIIAGIVVTINSMNGGATNPALTNVFNVIGDERYQTVVWPYLTEIDVVKDLLDARFNVNDDVQDGVGLIPAVDSKANLLILANSHNSQNIVIIGDKIESIANIYEAPAIFELPWIKVASIGAIRGLRLTDGADISQFTISRNGALDAFGGPAIASKPYFNSPIPNLPLVDLDKGLGKQDVEDLVTAGMTVVGNNKTGTDLIMGEFVTTYKTDTAGNPDVSFKFLNYVDTASNAREYFWNNLRARFAQSRLTEGDLVRGRDIANPPLIQAFATGLYSDLSGPDFVLVQSGEAALQFFKSNFVVSLDLSIGRATIQMKTPIVTQFREIIATMQIAFSVNG